MLVFQFGAYNIFLPNTSCPTFFMSGGGQKNRLFELKSCIGPYQLKTCQTRLILIMSQPFKVVLLLLLFDGITLNAEH